MDILNILLIIAGLCVFEVVSSIDNAIINADVLKTMKPRARKWFLFYGLIFAVFVVRGLLPWLIVWLSTPGIGPINALIATFSGDPAVMDAVEKSAPILLMGGGVYLIFLFLHWWFMEPKKVGLIGEKFAHSNGIWFYSVVSGILAFIVWYSIKINPFMAFAAVVGSTAFFITHGFKQNAEFQEIKMKKKGSMTDVSKIMYLEVIDTTFSIDGVLGAFAFTMSVPLIIIGNGLGALIVRTLTVKGINVIKKYAFLKNGAMYSIYALGIIMLLDSFGLVIPSFVSPIVTFAIVGYFFWKSKQITVKDFVEELN